MDLSVYIITATITTFAVGAAVGLWLSVVSGQWDDLNGAALVVLDFDDPMPVRTKGAR